MPKGPKLDPKLGFLSFLKFGSLVFLEIAYSDSLQQCITSNRGKPMKIFLGDQLWVKTGQDQAQN